VTAPAVVSGICAWVVVAVWQVLERVGAGGGLAGINAALGWIVLLVPVGTTAVLFGLGALAVAAVRAHRAATDPDPRPWPKAALAHAAVAWAFLAGCYLVGRA
jgi:hypothetical protein